MVAVQYRDYTEEQHPRDESGRWTSGGGGETSSTPTSEKPAGEFQTTTEAMAGISQLLGPGHSIPVLVGPLDHPQALAAANTTYDVLSEMKERGYNLPDGVDVMAVSRPDVAGSTLWFPPAIDAPIGQRKMATNLQIMIPRALPPEADLDNVVANVFGPGGGKAEGAFTVRSMRDIVLHEMGHVQAGLRRPAEGDPYDGFASSGNEYSLAIDTARTVSEYAATNVNEFLAEGFVRLYRGETLTPEAQTLYSKLNGPKVK